MCKLGWPGAYITCILLVCAVPPDKTIYAYTHTHILAFVYTFLLAFVYKLYVLGKTYIDTHTHILAFV